jgi:hypothetical protein
LKWALSSRHWEDKINQSWFLHYRAHSRLREIVHEQIIKRHHETT